VEVRETRLREEPLVRAQTRAARKAVELRNNLVREAIFGDPEKQKQDQEEAEDKRLTNAAKDAAKKAGVSPSSATPEPGEPLSPQERQELQEVLNNLTPEDRKKLEDLAKQAIDKEQVDLLAETFGDPTQLTKNPNDGIHKPAAKPSNANTDPASPEDLKQAIDDLEKQLAEAQAREDAQAEQQRKEDAARLAKEIRDNQMRLDGFTPDLVEDEALFDRYKECERSTASYVAPFVKSLSALLPKERQLAFEGNFYSGKKLDTREIPRRAPVKDYKIHKRPVVEESPRPKMFIELLIDNTGSMAGQKMEETVRAAVFWGRVLEVFEIPFSIKLFGTSVVSIKDFDEDIDDPRNRIKYKLMKYANASMGSTDIGQALQAAKQEMLEKRRIYKDSLGAIFLLSDSGANTGLTGDALAREALDIAQRYALTNFILTNNQREIDEAKKIFGEKNVVAPQDFNNLCPESIRVLRGTLDAFRRKLKL
jgi:hypothetical protein